MEVGKVSDKDALLQDAKVRVFHGKGRTLMSGLGDAHTHFTWNGGDLARLGELGIEEHVLLTARSAQCYIDSGYTMFVRLYPYFNIRLTHLVGASELPQQRKDSMLSSEMPSTLETYLAHVTWQMAKKWHEGMVIS